jgi:hypothetical protein
MTCSCDVKTYAVDLFRFIGRETTSPSNLLIGEPLEFEGLVAESRILCWL